MKRKRFEFSSAAQTGFKLVQADPETAKWTLHASNRGADDLRRGNFRGAIGNFLVSCVGFALLFWTLEQTGRK
jgi:hypothetical protein